jgi:Cd2+/Zn2+-exporting ATPase
MATSLISPDRAEFRIKGMDCAEEVSLLRRELSREKGIRDLQFDVFQGRMTVEFNPAETDRDRIQDAVARTGMRAEPWTVTEPNQPWWKRQARLLFTAASGLCLLSALALTLLHERSSWVDVLAHQALESPEPTVLALYVLAMILGSVYTAPKALAAFRRLQPEMNALVSVSIVGAAYLGEWGEGATLAFLFSLAGLLESWSLGRAHSAVKSLLDYAPATANKLHHDHEHRVSVEALKPGDQVRVRPGERVPCDGEIVSGESSIDQALITGESVPVPKGPGAKVYAGTINGEGSLVVRVSKPAQDTTLARIVRMVEGSASRRAASEQFVEAFSRWYTPAMFLLALLVMVIPPLFAGADWGYWFYQGMVLLLISCPCALVISTPVTVVAALASAARQGVLVKGGAFLEQMAQVRAVAFDKTGVLTEGEPVVETFRALNGYSEQEALERLAALERASEHPLGRAISRYAAARGVRVPAASSFQTIQGRGAEAGFNGTRFWAGNQRLLREKGLESPEINAVLMELEDAAHTAVVCGTPDQVWAVVGLRDPVRPGARESLQALRSKGIERITLVTGDNAATAKAVADEVGIEEVQSELLPDGKVEAVRDLRKRYGRVAMVGDGVNDVQAMNAANVGIALGQRATDVALETADIVVMSCELSRVPFILSHARRAASVIRQNVAIALGCKAVFLGLAAFQMATLWLAVAADMGATLLVTLNGLRMLWVPPRQRLAAPAREFRSGRGHFPHAPEGGAPCCGEHGHEQESPGRQA